MRAFFEIVVYILTIVQTVITIKDIIVMRPILYGRSLLANPTKVFHHIVLLSVLIMLPLRFACSTYGEDILSVLVIIFLGGYSLYFGR
mgnify:CR=1 FL=1